MFNLTDVRKWTLSLVALCSFSTLGAAELQQSFPIRGRVKDMTQSTSASGVPLQVHFQQIRYSGNVNGATIEKSGDQYDVEMTLQNVTLQIGRTSIRGSFRISADTGPMSIRLGTRNDLRVRYKVAIDQNKVRVLNSSLRLDDDNWQIGRPSSVRTSGFGVTEQRVVSGLQSGLRENRGSIENILIEESPRILSQMESAILAHVSPKTVPQNESSEQTQIAANAAVDEIPVATLSANELDAPATELIELASENGVSNTVLSRIDDEEWSEFEPAARTETETQTRFTSSATPTEIAPPVGNITPRLPTIRLRHRVRSLLRGTIGVLGFAN